MGALFAAQLVGSSAAESLPPRLAYVHDDGAHAARNRQQRNYWDAYLPELLDELGLRANAIAPSQLADAKALHQFDTLLVGGLTADRLPGGAGPVLAEWVRRGGTLVLSGTGGLDELAGVASAGPPLTSADEFACVATLELTPSAFTHEIHSRLAPAQKLLIFSETRRVTADNAVELAKLFDHQGAETRCSAITLRTWGEGRIGYFAFHLPQTIWILHQGRPVERDYDGDSLLRRSDAIVIRPHAIEVAYADELLLVLQNMIASRPRVFIHAIPPDSQGEIPQALFHWGGDDEGSNEGIQVFASDWMRAHGLPYHINAMPRADGTFGLSPQDAAHVVANGHELAIHFNFIDNFPRGAGFSREQLLQQGAAYQRHFGQPWVCSVNHWTRWTGWTEPIKWMREAGGLADNSFVHCGSPPANPVNRLGFSFGTAFPFWFYDDWTGQNTRIDFLELPITAYECGYVGQQAPDFDTIHQIVDMAAHYHQTINMFFHPVYIAKYPHCRAAIEGMQAYLDEQRIRPLHLGNDALCHWWRARSAITIADVAVHDDGLAFTYQCDYPTGWIAKVPLATGSGRSATANSASARFQTEHRFGQNWLLVALPAGSGSARVTWSKPK